MVRSRGNVDRAIDGLCVTRRVLRSAERFSGAVDFFAGPDHSTQIDLVYADGLAARLAAISDIWAYPSEEQLRQIQRPQGPAGIRRRSLSADWLWRCRNL